MRGRDAIVEVAPLYYTATLHSFILKVNERTPA